MVLLRHIVGNDLKKLEKQLELIEKSIVIVGVNSVNGNWYIHFLVQDISGEDQPIRVEVAKKTKTVKA